MFAHETLCPIIIYWWWQNLNLGSFLVQKRSIMGLKNEKMLFGQAKCKFLQFCDICIPRQFTDQGGEIKKKIAKYYLEKRVIKNYQSCEFISKLEYWGRDRDIFYLLILFFIF